MQRWAGRAIALLLVCVSGCLVDSRESTVIPEAIDLQSALDLDSDGKHDFFIRHMYIGTVQRGSSVYHGTVLHAYGANSILVAEGDDRWSEELLVLREDVLLGNSLPDGWAWEGGVTLNAAKELFEFPPKYVGLRLGRADTARYGWIQLSLHPDTSSEAPRVKAYGYAVSKPGGVIRTGG